MHNAHRHSNRKYNLAIGCHVGSVMNPLSGRVNRSMIVINELAQTNAQISERDQVP